MPDPLTTVADEFAPAPLNIFDPKLAESVISRHGNALRGAQSSERLAQAKTRAYDDAAAKRREERDAMLATQDELDFAEKRDADAMRGDIIADMYENLRPTEEGYDERVTEFLGNAPPSVVKDPVFNEVLRGLTRRADTTEEERRKVREVETRQINATKLIAERAKYDDTMKFLTAEDLKTLPVDENGEPRLDSAAAGILAGQRKREAGVEDYGKKTEIRKNAAIDILTKKGMDSQQQALYDETEDILINSPEAFPRRTDNVLARAEKAGETTNPSILRELPRWGAELAKAEAWDKNIFKNEVLTAKKAKTPEEYINFTDVEGKPVEITPTAEEYRRRVWDYAHQNDSSAAPTTATPAAPAAPSPTSAAPAPSRTVVSEVQHPKGYIIRKYSDGKTVKVMSK